MLEIFSRPAKHYHWHNHLLKSFSLKERTSWDGAALITAGVCFLMFKGIATLVAYAAIAYGAWTLWKEEYKG